jgi:hypothetical protein
MRDNSETRKEEAGKNIIQSDQSDVCSFPTRAKVLLPVRLFSRNQTTRAVPTVSRPHLSSCDPNGDRSLNK